MRVRGSETLDINYSHSFTCVCRDANLVDSRLVVSLGHLAPNLAVCLRVGVWDKTWDNAENYSAIEGPQFHF